MTGQQQRDKLHSEIWKIANDVRGAVDGWDFKQFVLGALFYRFISENFINYIEAGDDSINYAGMSDADIPDEAMIDAVKTKGYCIYPSQLFSNVVAAANTNESLNTELDDIFKKIEASANGYPSEWSAPIGWSSLNVNAWSAFGLSGRCFWAPGGGSPKGCAA